MFNTDDEVLAAKKRLSNALNKSVKRHLRELAKSRSGVQRVTLTVRDRDHFYKIVHYCNKNYGRGSHYWTTAGRVLRFVDPSKPSYNPPRIIDFIIYAVGADISALTTF